MSPPRRPFAFAVQAAPAKHPGEWAALARRAEDLGYRALLVPDHQGSGGPLTGMAAAGAVTTSLRVGSLVIGVDFHNPVVLTQELMTLDAVLGGRLEVGLGAGWMERDYERTGIAMDRPGARLARLREFVDVFQRLWSGAPTNHSGSTYGFRGAIGAPKPHNAEPHLVLGGGGRAMVRLAAELASIVNLGASMVGGASAALGETAGIRAFDRRVELIAEVVDKRGTWPELQCLVYEACVTNSAFEHARDRISSSFGLPPDEVLESPLALVGTVDELCDKIERLRERLGISYWVVKSAVLDDFAPVVARLAGA